MICPKCSSSELRVHGARVEVGWRRRWGWFGRWVPRIATRGLDVSCADCMFAFVSRREGITDAPLQTAFDSLKAVQAARNGPIPAAPPKEEEPAPAPRNIARPAGDPRVRRR